MALGFIHSMQTFSEYIHLTLISLCALNILIIVIEAKTNPDLSQMQEDQREDQTFRDKPYTCMMNPFLPSIGISCSAVVIGYMDLIVWVIFFVVLALTFISYFFYVIPQKHKEKLEK